MRNPTWIIALAASLTVVSPARAQLLAAGIGPAYPSGDFDDELNPGTGFLLSGRLNLGLFPLLQLQFEATTVQGWELASGFADPAEYELITGGANLALHFVRVAKLRPYALAGILGAHQNEAVDDDGAWSFGYQTGLGLDLRLGPLLTFAEVRWVSVDAPGDIRHTYVPIILGLKLL